MKDNESVLGMSGLLVATIKVDPSEFHKIKVTGSDIKEWNPEKGLAVITRKNAFVNIGLNNTLDKVFELAAPGKPTHIGLSSSTAAVTAATTTLGGTVSIKAFSPAASRTNQTVTAGATFTQADVAFVISKVGLLNTSTDAGTGLYDVIGGSGSSPYNQPFTIDLTGTSSFSLTMQIQVSASAS